MLLFQLVAHLAHGITKLVFSLVRLAGDGIKNLLGIQIKALAFVAKGLILAVQLAELLKLLHTLGLGLIIDLFKGGNILGAPGLEPSIRYLTHGVGDGNANGNLHRSKGNERYEGLPHKGCS